MSVRDRFTSRLREIAEDMTGLTVAETTELEQLREDAIHLRTFREDASELAWHTLDYFSGRPQDMTQEARARLSQKARVAFWEDPLAGAEADHYANFAIGRGVPIPQAKDKEVQRVIDEAWKDPNNVDKLVGFDALRAVSNELRAGANLFPVAYVGQGRVKIGWLNPDWVVDYVPDPEDEDRPLWYLARTRRVEWDFEQDRAKTTDQLKSEEVEPKVLYWPHWRNLEEARAERRRRGEEPLDEPPEAKLGPGLVHHVRVNRLLKQQFGSSPWRRTLRFYTAMNRFTEARVAMAQAASSFVAKRITKGGNSDVLKAAKSILNQAGEIGSARAAREAEVGRGGPAPRPASIWNENESHKLESLSLNSGAAQAVQDGQIIRGAATAPSGFGQHYFGDASNANLATASALELPALMAVGAWQETLEGMLRWFTDLSIQEAVRSGRLGGRGRYEGETDRPLSELRLAEAADKAEAEKRTGKNLDYTLSMPYPGRRPLPDVISALQAVFSSIPGAQRSETMIQTMLNFFFTHGLELDDPQGITEEVVKELIEAAKQEAEAAAAAGEDPNNPPPDGKGKSVAGGAVEPSTYGEKKRGTPGAMSEMAWLPDELMAPAATLGADVQSILSTLATDPDVLAAVTGRANV